MQTDANSGVGMPPNDLFHVAVARANQICDDFLDERDQYAMGNDFFFNGNATLTLNDFCKQTQKKLRRLIRVVLKLYPKAPASFQQLLLQVALLVKAVVHADKPILITGVLPAHAHPSFLANDAPQLHVAEGDEVWAIHMALFRVVKSLNPFVTVTKVTWRTPSFVRRANGKREIGRYQYRDFFRNIDDHLLLSVRTSNRQYAPAIRNILMDDAKGGRLAPEDERLTWAFCTVKYNGPPEVHNETIRDRAKRLFFILDAMVRVVERLVQFVEPLLD
ncbi:hypothetical protein HDU96_006937 [Phlyctochytrium bullatum]|nr:hypothetical protein HDU96_006937 [Phlyctochytrium bullatum]